MRIEPVGLQNRWVRLEPYAPDLKDAVRTAINVDEAGWSIMLLGAFGDRFKGWWDRAVEGMAAGRGPRHALRRPAVIRQPEHRRQQPA